VNVLVDTSVWSLGLRRAPHNLSTAEQTNLTELTELVKEGRARIIGPIRQELLSGIKTQSQFERLRTKLEAFPDEPLGTADFESAASAYNLCRSRGIVATPTDILICAVAVSRAFYIFTTDPDFRRYAAILPVQIHSRRR